MKLKNIIKKLTFGLLLLLVRTATSQNVTVSPNAGSYATLSQAFNAINAGQHTGAITINVIGNTNEPSSGAQLNASGVGSASYTSILIQPTGGVGRSIVGAIDPGVALITLNGADNVTINGLNSNSNSLTFENTTVSDFSGTSTITFTNDASNNIITNCSILGSCTMNKDISGGNILFRSTTGITGNDNNTISYCNITRSGANYPSKCIFMFGASNNDPGAANSGNQILNNNIFDFFSPSANSSGIEIITGTVNTTISSNKFYQSSHRILTSPNLQHRPINVNNVGGSSFNVTNNTIGYQNANGTGVYSLEFATGTTNGSMNPIHLSVNSSSQSFVQNNNISNISISGNAIGIHNNAPFKGIYVSAGRVTANGNNIGSMSTVDNIICTMSSTITDFIDILGIYNSGTANFESSGNNIGGIQASTNSGGVRLFGLFYNSTLTSTQWICNNNTIGGDIDNSIYVPNFSNNTRLNGIINTSPSLTASGNIIRNMTAFHGAGPAVVGISLNETIANHMIANNQIYNLKNTNTGVTNFVYGIYFNGGSNNLIENNYIHSLSVASSAESASVYGFYSSTGSIVFRNNMIAIGSGVALSPSLYGVIAYSGNITCLNNTIYLSGESTTGSSNTFCLGSYSSGNNRVFRNNIFYNARTRSGTSTSSHFAIVLSGTSQNPPGLTINNNIYHVSGIGGYLGYYNGSARLNLDAWRSAIGQDSFSMSGNPVFRDPTATFPDLRLRPGIPTIAESAGVDLGVLQDFEGETRSNLTPVDIGADAGNYISNFCPGTPNGGIISPSNVQKCTGQTHTMYASSSYGVGYVYQWKVSTTTGGPYFNVTGGTGGMTQTYTTPTLTPGTYYYILVTTCAGTGISSSSSQLILTISDYPVLSVSPTNPVLCLPGSSPIQLNATGANTYLWSPASGLSSTTIANPIANPTTSTSYTVIGTSVGCTDTATVILKTQNLPVVSSVTATPNNICINESSLLNVVPEMSAKYYTLEASLETYSPISGTIIPLSNTDDGGATNLPIGFNFRFNNVVYSTFSVSTNGFIGFGSGINVANYINSLGTSANIVAPFWDDNYMNGGNIMYLTEGTIPNRTTTIQWTGMHVGASTYPTIDCQVKLNEIDSSITFIYGPISSNLIGASASIGISTASGNFSSLTPVSPIINTVTSSTTANNSINSAINIPSGTRYKFNPPAFSYLWSPVNFLNNNTIKSPMASSVNVSTTYTVTVTTSLGCSNTGAVVLNLEGMIVKNSNNSGFNSLRNVIQCANENSVITYDQSIVNATILTTPLQINKNLTLAGLSAAQRPQITLPSTGLSIISGKVLTLQNIDLKSINNNPTFIDPGSVNITGLTVIKN